MKNPFLISLWLHDAKNFISLLEYFYWTNNRIKIGYCSSVKISTTEYKILKNLNFVK